jgi:hypothetical protein
MLTVLLTAGIALLSAGLVAVGYGIQVKEFSFGNTLILSGTALACTGAMMLAVWVVIQELRNIARRIGPGIPGELRAGNQTSEDESLPFGRDQLAKADREPAARPAAPPWQGDLAPRDRGRREAPAVPEFVEPPPAAKSRRNLMFSSFSRKERERGEARTSDLSAAGLRSAPPAAAPPFEPAEPPPAPFDAAWPRSERLRILDAPLPRRGTRAPTTFDEMSAGSDGYTSGNSYDEDQPAVAVLKSGVVDGMAYSLYSDGSIEAQMPEGMMRFASIDELRAHLEQRS